MFQSFSNNIARENREFECNCRRVERDEDDLRRRKRFICTQVQDRDRDGRMMTRFICREIRGTEQTMIY